MSKGILALIPARGGSERSPGKNVRPLAGHPLIAYSIAAARAAPSVSRVVVSTDSEEIAEVARRFGAEVPFLRPPDLASSTSPDVEWVRHALEQLEPTQTCFAIVRPTSPFRTATTIERAYAQFVELSARLDIDSIRAIERCRQHPGKMWVVEGDLMRPLLDQDDLDLPWHASQYQALPSVYVQNSSLEISWKRVVSDTGTHCGRRIAPFFTLDAEGFSIDYEDDWLVAEWLLRHGRGELQEVLVGS